MTGWLARAVGNAGSTGWKIFGWHLERTEKEVVICVSPPQLQWNKMISAYGVLNPVYGFTALLIIHAN